MTRIARSLDSRLSALADAVRPGMSVADIGTDHAYLICHLIESGKCPRGWACDIGEKPLKKAVAEITARGLSEKIRTCLTDGLKGLPLDEIDDIVVAGLGGDLIAEILQAAPHAHDKRLSFVLQPMTKAQRLRRRLCELGFELRGERGVRSGRFIYPVMTVAYTGLRREPDELFEWIGLLPRDSHPDSRALLQRTRDRLLKAADGASQSAKSTAQAVKWRELAHEINRLTQDQS